MPLDTHCLEARHNLLLDASDRVKLCCNSADSLDFDDGIVDHALIGRKATEIQQALDSGVAHSNCSRCWREQRNGTYEQRASYNDLYPEFESIGKPQLKTIHLQNDPTCNLACVYCGATYSTKWADLLGEAEPMIKTLDFSDESLAGLELITMAGGEPGLIKSNAKLLDRLLKLNPECKIVINSNLYRIDTPVFDRVVEFPNVVVIGSFESVGNRYNYIRQGSDWAQFSRNFAAMARRVPRIQASMLLFPLSIGGIADAIDFALEHTPPEEIFINDCYGGRFEWSHVNQTALAALKEKLANYIKTVDPEIQSRIEPRLAQIESTATVTQFPDVINFDQMVGQDHRKIFPELYQ
jgi:Radical SAM superfamily